MENDIVLIILALFGKREREFIKKGLITLNKMFD